MIIENLLYVVIGFVVTYLLLELAWHFTACRIKDKKLKPCMFKEIKVILIELTFANEHEAFFELLCILLKESGRITFRVRQ